MKPLNLYETPELRDVTGDTIRPGGLVLTEKAAELCGFKSGMRVLDAGCGIGATVAHLSEKYGLFAVGVDASLALLTKGAAKSTTAGLLAARIPHLPFRPGVFHGIFCECVLSLLNDRPEALKAVHTLLAPGGHLILTDIYAREANATIAGNQAAPFVSSCINGALPLDAISSMVSDAGFSIRRVEDHSALLRELAVKLIFQYGSLSRFWQNWCSGSSADAVCSAASRIKPGYYLLIAQKV